MNDREWERDRQARRPTEGKRPYRPPELVRFGRIAKWVRGGEGTNPDGATGGFDFTGAEP